MRKILVVMIGILIPRIMFSQELPVKKFDHYASVQANQLIKELINLSTSSDITNPYLLEYTCIFNKYNLGINAGFGYTFTKSEDSEHPDAKSLQETNLSFFAGLCKRQVLGSKFELTYG